MQPAFSANGGKLPVKMINGNGKVVLCRTLPDLIAIQRF